MNLLDLFVKVGVDDQASSQIETLGGKITSRLGNAVKTVGKLMAGVAAGAGAGAIAITKAAVDSYASYEQLVGGVDKLYQGASDKLQQYAQNAYKTSGMSANSYMEQATSFSAALINSLGGDVDKAADQTDKAMRLMSDNVNTFGSDAEAVQNAIQGLSRANFTMLDNLKLGYAGTKQGMENLIADAEKYAQTVKGMGFDEYAEQMKETGLSADELRKRYDELTNSTDLSIDSFSDMIDAIDIIQEKQHIMGTTSREAMSTIEGSWNSAKASWDNLLVAIGSGDGEMVSQSVTGLVDSIFGTFSEEAGKREGGLVNNLLPVLQNVGNALMQQLPTIAGQLVEAFVTAINDAFGTDFQVDGISQAFADMPTKAQEAFDQIGQIASDFWEGFSSTFDSGSFQSTFENIQSIAGQAFDFLTENADEIGAAFGIAADVLGTVADAITTVADALGPFLPAIVGAVAALAGFSAIQPIIALVTGAFTTLTTVILPAMGMVQSFGGAIALVTTLLGGPIPIIVAVVGAIVAFVASNEDAKTAIVNAWQSFVDFISGIPAWWSGVWEQVTQFARSAADRLHSMWTDLKNKATATWNNIKSMISNAMNGAKDAVINAMVALKNGVVNKFNEVVDFVRSIPSRISNAIGDLSGTLRNAGTSLIGGLFGGITSKAEEMFNYVSGIAGKIQALKGPLPYDRKVLIPNGIALMQSLQTGLSKGYEALVAPYLSGMASQMAVNFDAGMTGVGRPVQAQATVPSIYIGEMVVRDRRDAEYFARKVSQIWTREMNGALA